MTAESIGKPFNSFINPSKSFTPTSFCLLLLDDEDFSVYC
jgi:hypothetical protein